MLICYGLTASFCTISLSLAQMSALSDRGHRLIPVCSSALLSSDTRFGSAADLKKKIELLCGRPPVASLVDAEPIGPKLHPDLMIIAPATGNTLAKLRHGVYDTPVTLAAKSVLRSGSPLLLAPATNDALSGNFENIANLFNRKNVFFVPMSQDDPVNKPFSLVAAFHRIPDAVNAALNRQQLLPLFI